VTDSDAPVLRLTRWSGSWEAGDPDANLKRDVAASGVLDPMVTLRGLSASTGMPIGALARYVLARWATAGSGGLLELGPAMVERLWEPVAKAETANTDEQRLAAYHQLREMLAWLRFPLDNPDAYPEQNQSLPSQ
jgi:hypothetical protein